MTVKKQSGEEQVATFLSELQHPFKAEIEEVRRIVLEAVPELTEHIKWNAPSFCYAAEDRITFQLQGKGFFRLIFHTGAKAQTRTQSGKLIEDHTGLLDWAADDRAIIKLTDLTDVMAKKDKLIDVISKWIEATKQS